MCNGINVFVTTCVVKGECCEIDKKCVKGEKMLIIESETQGDWGKRDGKQSPRLRSRILLLCIYCLKDAPKGALWIFM